MHEKDFGTPSELLLEVKAFNERLEKARVQGVPWQSKKNNGGGCRTPVRTTQVAIWLLMGRLNDITGRHICDL